LEPNSEILTAEDELITKTLGLTKSGLYVGLLEGKPTIKTFIDPEKLLTRHLAVIAKSGVGKSYSVAVILEELMEKGFPVIVIDPHGEYSSMKYENQHAEDKKYFEENRQELTRKNNFNPYKTLSEHIKVHKEGSINNLETKNKSL